MTATQKLLRKLLKNDLLKSELTAEELEAYSFLCNDGMIKVDTILENDDSLKQIDTKLHITSKGKDAYYNQRLQSRRWAVPVMISLVALIKSFLPEIRAALELILKLLTPQ